MPVQVQRGRGRHQEAAARNKLNCTMTLALESIMSPCGVCAKPAELGLYENLCVYIFFLSLFELVEAPHRVRTVPKRLTAMPFIMRQQKLDKLMPGT